MTHYSVPAFSKRQTKKRTTKSLLHILLLNTYKHRHMHTHTHTHHNIQPPHAHTHKWWWWWKNRRETWTGCRQNYWKSREQVGLYGELWLVALDSRQLDLGMKKNVVHKTWWKNGILKTCVSEEEWSCLEGVSLLVEEYQKYTEGQNCSEILTPSLLCMHVHSMLGNKIQKLKSCGFFLTSMLMFLHQNVQYWKVVYFWPWKM